MLALDDLLEHRKAVLVLTPMMGELLTEIEYQGENPGAYCHIYALINRWVTEKGTGVVWFMDDDGPVHAPIPCCEDGNTDLWLRAAGSIDSALKRAGAPCGAVGVVCVRGSAGEATCNAWDGSETHLVLVATSNLDVLGGAYTFSYRQDVVSRDCTLSSVRSNYRLLGATGIRSVRDSGGSHVEKLVFDGRRPWPLDVNDDPIPDKNLMTLCECADLPRPYVKTVLNTGSPPERRPWLCSDLTGVEVSGPAWALR